MLCVIFPFFFASPGINVSQLVGEIFGIHLTVTGLPAVSEVYLVVV